MLSNGVRLSISRRAVTRFTTLTHKTFPSATSSTTTTCSRSLSMSQFRYVSTAQPKSDHEPNNNNNNSTGSNDGGSVKDEEMTMKDAPSKDSLRDAINRIQQEDKKKRMDSSSSGSDNNTNASTETTNNATDSNDIFRRAADLYDAFQYEVRQAWTELMNAGRSKDINKKVVTPSKEAYTGPVDIMVIDEAEGLTAWERMQRRLTEAPIIQDILERSDQFLEQTGAKKVHRKIEHLKEDAREAWETSQNPWVYRISSVYDTVTAESEETVAVKELRRLDPGFQLEEWRKDVVEHTLPQIMKWFLEGDMANLEPWMGESVFKRIVAEMTARKQEGVQIDTHVLGIMNSEIIAIERDHVEKGSPIILLHFMCQQINCVKKKKDGTIIEGAEDDIRANSYVAAFQREYNAEEGELNWKIVDFRFNGAIAYL